jgi:hypothetical protein|tara:strand:- start:964 stop:1200 length:237 start_codon:yes stop_codon:yes gene_type:complete
MADPKLKGDEQLNFDELELNRGTDNLINLLSKVKVHTTSVPTNVPTNFLDQFVFYDDEAGTERLYIYINNTWRYVALT